jgi:ABC-type nitrate/sulfonate/bicarbonate transport system substrate-binding protein
MRLPVTPDGRYFVVRGRLWRRSNPALPAELREALVKSLMKARRDVASARKAEDRAAEADARRRVHKAKVALGERGPVGWTDGAPDYNRHMARSTPYADWYESLGDEPGEPRLSTRSKREK